MPWPTPNAVVERRRQECDMADRSNQRQQPIPSSGLTVVVDPEEPRLDIVFVHGFTGHPERTWTHKHGDVPLRQDRSTDATEPAPKARRLTPFSTSRHGSAQPSVYWPRDLLSSTVPDARVLTYGYDTHIRHTLGAPMSRSTVYDISWDFLVALEAERRADPSRPALFVAHSLGGIVVKEMLRRSSGCHQNQSQLHGIFKFTIGIMFFGTPHGGADPRGILQQIAERAIKAAGFSVNEHIVNTLLPSSERLRELRDEFGPMAQNWRIHSFQEQLGVTALSGHKVVEDTSSYLNLPAIEVTEHIGRNHMDMCRFTGLADVEFKKVASALDRMTGSVSRKFNGANETLLSNEHKKILLESLRFDQIDARHLTIKNAYARTCKWLLQRSEYVDWLDNSKLSDHQGFLWIKGKPGAGKSTLMKFAVANARRTIKDRIVISFFFNARGEALESSTTGMYRSLLLQLLEKLPELQSVFDSLGLLSLDPPTYRQWSIESLKTLFEQAILQLENSSVVCFIDALDECDPGEIRDMVSFFEHIGNLILSAGIVFQVCFSSRHYPSITIRKGLSLVLEGQDDHREDIIKFVNGELKIGHGKIAEQVRIEVQEKAAGIFMWVALVVDILNQEYSEGRIHALRRRIQDIPGDLHELFRDILTRDSKNRNELFLCLQWVLFARQPLAPEELYFAILSGVEPEALSVWKPNEITTETMKKFILSCSKGLIETTTSKIAKVQFIHESVSDFLAKETGLGQIWPEFRHNFRGQSHQQLKHCCLNYLDISIATTPELGDKLPRASEPDAAVLREKAKASFPFLQYAVRNVLYHADLAQESGISQEDFIQKFPLTRWVKLENLLQKHEIRRYTPNVSLLYILAEFDLPSLVSIHPSILSSFKEEDERYGLPIFAALATGSERAAQTIIKAHVSNLSPQKSFQKLYNRYIEARNTESCRRRDFKFNRRRTVLSNTVLLGDEALFALLLETGQHPPNKKDVDMCNPLLHAAEVGHEGILKLLLATEGIEVEPKGRKLKMPLHMATERGRLSIVELLIQDGRSDPDVRDIVGRTPLSLAAQRGHNSTVELLIQDGRSDPDVRDVRGRTPLILAAQSGYNSIVELLIRDGRSDPNVRDAGGMTPLSLAAQSGYNSIVELLIRDGRSDPNVRDAGGMTPLSLAAQRGHNSTVELLIQDGRSDPDVRDVRGRTPLSRAAGPAFHSSGHAEIQAEIAKLLLNTGRIDPDSRDRENRSPLLWAARSGFTKVAELLLARDDLDPNSTDEFGHTPIIHAIAQELKNVVKLLLAHPKLDVNYRGNRSEGCALLRAVRVGSEPIVELLLAHNGIDPNCGSQGKDTPILRAVRKRHYEIIELLLAHPKIDLNVQDYRKMTPLLQAAMDGDTRIVKQLLATNRVDLDHKDGKGKTALMWASERGHLSVVELLLAKGANPGLENNCA